MSDNKQIEMEPVVAKDLRSLKKIIKKAIKKNGNNCDLNFIDGDLEKFFLQFSDDELISWNNEYFKYMDNKLNAMYEEEVSFENLRNYSSFLVRMSEVYTTIKENYILYLENIKKYISKYMTSVYSMVLHLLFQNT